MKTGKLAEGTAPSAMLRSARCIGQVDWTWSPMHMRIDAYYLSMCSHHRHRVLWSKGYDDSWGRWMDPSAMAVASRAGLPVDAAARLMLHDCWTQERDCGLDLFHWVNEGGILDVGELAEVASAVWGDATGEPEEQQEADLQPKPAARSRTCPS